MPSRRPFAVALAALLLTLPVVAQAQVPCDPEAFPGVSYAARTETPTAFLGAALKAGADVGPEHTLIVTDIDNTLLDMYTDLGADQWYRWQSALIAECGMDATRRELVRNGIDIAATAPAGNLDLPSPDASRPVRYVDGLAMVSGYNKGARLLELLEALGIDDRIERIVFLDDREKNVCQVQQAFDAAGQHARIAVLRYDALRSDSASRSPSPVTTPSAVAVSAGSMNT
jgi:hypothetical protein